MDELEDRVEDEPQDHEMAMSQEKLIRCLRTLCVPTLKQHVNHQELSEACSVL